ncbi:hypothetical protein [Haloferax sp. ATB1]|uniref:hypothetical protein n=1 Tax=Haloferax sp. ATB1 TaxID=1508454 RepID=UPI000A54DA0C|nr:hypothetical protein [Haloferax sp. ATB1]
MPVPSALRVSSSDSPGRRVRRPHRRRRYGPGRYGFSLVDTAETVPAGDADAFVSELRSVARRENADVIFPLNAADVEALSEAKPPSSARVSK